MLADHDHFKLSTVLSICLVQPTASYIQHSYMIRLIMKYIHSPGLVIFVMSCTPLTKVMLFFRSQPAVNVGRYARFGKCSIIKS